jgi:catechol 2,3-dioxygenase-like lactoylglutathione lyase family enzyme
MEDMLRVGMMVMGTSNLDRAERFWTAALGYQRRDSETGGDWRVLGPASGAGPEIALQRSDEKPRNHPRLHLDLWADGVPEQVAEAERLVGLGARRVDWDSYPADPDFIVLADTEGNRFCIVDVNHAPAAGAV